jgi:hypothetical protein
MVLKICCNEEEEEGIGVEILSANTSRWSQVDRRLSPEWLAYSKKKWYEGIKSFLIPLQVKAWRKIFH